MSIKIYGERPGPPSDIPWREYGYGYTSVAGLQHRRAAVLKFIRAAAELDPNEFGVTARRDAGNRHDRFAIAVDGWWQASRILGGSKLEKTHIGFLPHHVAEGILRGKSPEPRVFVELYSAYIGEDGGYAEPFVDLDVVVHCEMTSAEIEEEEAERAALQSAKEAKALCSGGLKALARIAWADGKIGREEEAIMREYTQARCARAGIALDENSLEKLIAAARATSPSDGTATNAVRLIADDSVALQELFDHALRLARADDAEHEAEIAVLRRMLNTAKKRRSD
jgi:uncharacterized tellurite resistance protein B-like protein